MGSAAGPRGGAGAPAFPIQRQITGEACVAASACSLLAWLGVAPPRQEQLDPCVQAGMRRGLSGFDALRACLAAAGSAWRVARRTPAAEELARWAAATPAASAGFLISHHVRTGGRVGAHVTVVFAAGGRWYRGDPSGGTVRPVALEELAEGYAGDVAVIEGGVASRRRA